MENVNGSNDPGMKCESVILPPEVVMEILSRLPLKPLARAQLVCKEWRALIQDHHFLDIHINHNSFRFYWYNVTISTTGTASAAASVSFTYLHGCDGLLLMKNNATKIYFLWNPAARLVLELPSPHNTGDHGFALSFAPTTKNYKIVSFFKDEASCTYGCQLLTPGSTMAWRPLPFPDAVDANSQLKASSVVPAGGAVHRIVLTEDGVVEIMSLDVETELVTLNRLPTGIFRGTQSARAIDCNGKLGFGVIVGQQLELMVLEDYKNNRWCRSKQVIPLPFLKDEGFQGSKVVILLIKQGEILFCLEDEKIFEHTIETGKINYVRKIKGLSLSNIVYTYKPSLVTFEGMQREDAELDRYRPRKMQLD